LLSVQKLCFNNNVYFEFHPFVFYIKDLKTKVVLLSSQSKDSLYALTKSSVTSVPQIYWSHCISVSANLWHFTSYIFNFLVLKNKIACNYKCLNFQSQTYPLGKSSRLSLGPTGHKTSALLELIFIDLWGSTPPFSFDGYFCWCAYKIYVVLPSCCKVWCLLCFSSISNSRWASIFTKNKIYSNWLGRCIPQVVHFLLDHWYSSSSDFSPLSWTKWNNWTSS